MINRALLFKRLRGFFTYGSPLDKFAYLWPRNVPLNPEERAVFSNDFEWINVYDDTDPVGGHLDHAPYPELDATSETRRDAPAVIPENLAYRACPVLLFSHIRYLQFKPGQPGLVNQLVWWLLDGRPLLSEGLSKEGDTLRKLWRVIQWGIVAVISAIVVARLLYLVAPFASLMDPLLSTATTPSTWDWLIREVLSIIGIAAGIVLIVGILGRLHEAFREAFHRKGGAR